MPSRCLRRRDIPKTGHPTTQAQILHHPGGFSYDPDQARAWSDDEVVRRWLAVFPGALRGTDNDEQKARVALTLRSNPQRLQEIRSRPLTPVAGLDAQALLGMTESSYLDLVQWTGEQVHPMKRGKLTREARSVADQPPDILWSLAGHPKQWLRQVQGTESGYYRAIGSTEALMAKAAELGQCRMKGVSGERAWLILQTQVK